MEPTPNPRPNWAQDLTMWLTGTEVTDGADRPSPLDEALGRTAALLLMTRAARRKVLVVGNGGSAAIASHLQTDLCHSLGIRALVFNEAPLLTAQTNDHGYAHAFANLVNLWAEPGDQLIAISSSGRSENILNAATTARAKGMGVVTLSGFGPDNPLRRLGDLNFYVACARYGPVETAHGSLLHHITDLALAGPLPEVFP